jgi:hypothetical protein
MMRQRVVPTLPAEQRAAALEKLEQRERADRAELESLQARRKAFRTSA